MTIHVYYDEISGIISDTSAHGSTAEVTTEHDGDEKNRKENLQLTEGDLHRFITPEMFFNLKTPMVQLQRGTESINIQATIDPDLQKKIMTRVENSSAAWSGIVVMNAVNGEILAMAGRDNSSVTKNTCTSTLFPAASIFKLVTAAGILEEQAITPEKKFTFNGRRHTLYRSQLKEGHNRYSNFVSLKDAFALSINPVFGKIGMHQLGREGLEKYAAAFAFKKEISFELPVTPSAFSIENNGYNLAEVASGFNRETRISPLHAALMASVVINDGIMIKPVLVKNVYDSKGNMVYRNRYAPFQRSISAETAKFLRKMMEETVRSGTARKGFAGYKRDRVLSKLIIGGKTGTIDSREHDIRYDWFCGFARDKEAKREIAIAVLTGHQKPRLGVRSTAHARFIIKEFFRDYFNSSHSSYAKSRHKNSTIPTS